jgi:general secretion pathway protein G
MNGCRKNNVAGFAANDSGVSASLRLRIASATLGFTLIELLTVLVIIMILVGIIVGASKYAQQRGGTTRSQAEIAAMETALEDYKNDNGFYPMSTPDVNNPGANSILLYFALVAGPKRYISFKPTEMRDFGNTTNINFICGTNPPISYTGITNVMIVDPFGHPYNYYNPCNTGGVNNQVSFDLWSTGPSGITGAVDNITNWKSN